MSESPATSPAANGDKVLFWGCFVALVATAFAFVVRTMLLNTFGDAFDLSQTQKAEISGVGLWPFAVSIVVFSLVIDKIGYRAAMIFAFACHATSAVLTIFATGYWSLWIATFIVALGNGTVEAFINPVVATMFRADKTKWLNILHAGWPGGLVLGGLLAMFVGSTELRGEGSDAFAIFTNWQIMVGLLLIPTVLYGAILLRRDFPVQERVAAGVPYRDMLGELGALGILIVSSLVCVELCRVFGVNGWIGTGAAVGISAWFGIYTRSLGRPMLIFLLLLMIPLATTELGVDGWITPIMEGQLDPPVLVLIYTAAIMMVLRMFAGPIVHRFSPLGLLATSSAIAAIGLFVLSGAVGPAMIFGAATLYALGKTFFWPTMLGVVSERFPRGGALTLNATGGVGMLSAGVVGAVFLGLIQDNEMVERLRVRRPEVAAQVIVEKTSVFGAYEAVDNDRRKDLPEADRQAINVIQGESQKDALSTAALFPIIMLVCYIGLILWFRARGGYHAVRLD